MHNIYAPFIITSVRVIHSVATPNPTLAVWRLPGPAPASCCRLHCCYEDTPHGNKETWTHEDHRGRCQPQPWLDAGLV